MMRALIYLVAVAIGNLPMLPERLVKHVHMFPDHPFMWFLEPLLPAAKHEIRQRLSFGLFLVLHLLERGKWYINVSNAQVLLADQLPGIAIQKILVLLRVLRPMIETVLVRFSLSNQPAVVGWDDDIVLSEHTYHVVSKAAVALGRARFTGLNLSPWPELVTIDIEKFAILVALSMVLRDPFGHGKRPELARVVILVESRLVVFTSLTLKFFVIRSSEVLYHPLLGKLCLLLGHGQLLLKHGHLGIGLGSSGGTLQLGRGSLLVDWRIHIAERIVHLRVLGWVQVQVLVVVGTQLLGFLGLVDNRGIQVSEGIMFFLVVLILRSVHVKKLVIVGSQLLLGLLDLGLLLLLGSRNLLCRLLHGLILCIIELGFSHFQSLVLPLLCVIPLLGCVVQELLGSQMDCLLLLLLLSQLLGSLGNLLLLGLLHGRSGLLQGAGGNSFLAQRLGPGQHPVALRKRL
mmetsp:Transcript_4983/g.8006  ORF Transcript_4983/g.8006 Transcript_4983/m.8006 type:complete len:459 (-) Transcript_4983:68-1444(-)